MFVRIGIDQSVTLLEGNDLQRLHVEVAGLDGRALRSAVKRNELGRVLDDGDIALRVATLRDLAGERDEQWTRDFAAMLMYARTKGWMVDDEHVRAHCRPIAAITLPSSSIADR